MLSSSNISQEGNESAKYWNADLNFFCISYSLLNVVIHIKFAGITSKTKLSRPYWKYNVKSPLHDSVKDLNGKDILLICITSFYF